MQDVCKSIENAGKWISSIQCHGQWSSTKPSSRQDIVPFLSPSSSLFSIHPKSSFMFDSSIFNGVSEDTKLSIKSYIIAACADNGFRLRLRSTASNRGNRLCTMIFVCEHNQEPLTLDWSNNNSSLRKPGVQKSFEKKSSSSKPTSDVHRPRKVRSSRPRSPEERCPFQLTIFCDSKDNCWYLGYSTGICGQHIGHLQLDRTSIGTSLANVSGADKEFAVKCFQSGIAFSCSAKVMSSATKNTLNTSQMKYLFQQLQKNDPSVFSSEDNFTSAEKLLSMFDNLIADGEEMSYLALTHSMTSGLHIKLPKGRPSKAINDPCKSTRNMTFYIDILSFFTIYYSQC